MNPRRTAGHVRYTLRHDLWVDDGPYIVERIEVMGTFATREEAKQYMLNSADERKARDRAAA